MINVRNFAAAVNRNLDDIYSPLICRWGAEIMVCP